MRKPFRFKHSLRSCLGGFVLFVFGVWCGGVFFAGNVTNETGDPIPRMRSSESTSTSVLCTSDGRYSVPALYFLGGQKAGSTSLFHQCLASFGDATLDVGTRIDTKAEMKGADRSWMAKEKFFWSKGISWNNQPSYGDALAMKWYLSMYESCSGDLQGERNEGFGTWNVRSVRTRTRAPVAADFCAAYLADEIAPINLADAYGAAKSHLRFIVLLKNSAVGVVVSYTYMNLRNQGRPQTKANAASRVERMSQVIQRECTIPSSSVSTADEDAAYARCVQKLTSEVRNTAYAAQLRRWFETFEPSQFIFVHTEYFLQHTYEAMEALSDALSLPIRERAHIVVNTNGKNNRNSKYDIDLSDENDVRMLRLARTLTDPLRRDLWRFLDEHVAQPSTHSSPSRPYFIGNIEAFRV